MCSSDLKTRLFPVLVVPFLVAFGLTLLEIVRPHDALAAGSWAARAYLGMPGLAEGAPADAVVYDSDPRADLAQLDHPRAVILRGRLLHRRRASRNEPKPGRRR